ncbi:MAG TPA: heavy metal-associated domain-containing protein [Nitrososphaerales archaeon]|nr:heavy metal-associated domain-containing protein [Nitrososphaerales archaeon]
MDLSETNGAVGVFTLVNMECSGCAVIVAKSLKKIDGIKNVEINYVTDKVYVKYDPTVLTSDKIRESIEKAGYKALDISHGRGIQSAKSDGA